MPSRRVIGTCPEVTASLSALPKKLEPSAAPGISRSRPALAALAVLWVAPQSETTKPAKCHRLRSAAVSRSPFSQA